MPPHDLADAHVDPVDDGMVHNDAVAELLQ